MKQNNFFQKFDQILSKLKLQTCILSKLLMMLFLIIIMSELSCRNDSDKKQKDPNKKTILVSFAPLYSLGAAIAGDDAVVECLLSDSGPHEHGDSITEEMIETARGADIIFSLGLGLDEAFFNKLKAPANNSKWKLIELGEKIDPKLLLKGICFHEHGDKNKEGLEKDHDHGTDPHLWLSPSRALALAEVMMKEMSELDPTHASNYESRFKTLQDSLKKLEQEGLELLKSKKEKKIVSFHDSLQYFAQTFGLEIAEVIQIDPGVEPSESKLNSIVKKCFEANIRVIAVEPQFPSHTSAKVILDALRKKGINAVFVEIDPLETADRSQLNADLYQRIMRKNFTAIADKLE